MSGLEVVGVVLGAIPLLISAIEKYKTASRTLKFYQQKITLVNELIRSLKEQEFFIKADLSLTLKATSIGQDDIAVLLQNPSLGVLDDQDLSDEIREYLGGGFQPYVEALANCQHRLMELARHLNGLISDDEQDIASLVEAYPPENGFYKFVRRIKFSITKDDIELQIKELDKNTLNLERIRRYSKAHAETTFPPSSRTVSKITSFFDVVADHANRLYAAISIGYKEQCCPNHEAQLFLQHRTDSIKGSRTAKKGPLAFTVGFGPARPNLRYKAEIKVLEEEQSYCVNRSGKNKRPMDQGDHPATTGPAGPKGKGKARVSFQTTDNNQDQQLQLSSVKDLCRHFSIMNCGEMFLSNKGLLCYSPLPPNGTTAAVNMDFTELIPLSHALQAGQLSLNQRMNLALNAASSVMQLNSTPWLDLPLDIKMLYLIPHGPVTSATPIQPLIKHNFMCAIINKPSYNARRTLLELGILLLELWHEQTFTSFIADAQLAVCTTLGSRYDAVSQWAEESIDNIMPFYYDMVKRCLECNFATSPGAPADFNWGDQTFRKSVCEHVLKPLWEECRLI